MNIAITSLDDIDVIVNCNANELPDSFKNQCWQNPQKIGGWLRTIITEPEGLYEQYLSFHTNDVRKCASTYVPYYQNGKHGLPKVVNAEVKEKNYPRKYE